MRDPSHLESACRLWLSETRSERPASGWPVFRFSTRRLEGTAESGDRVAATLETFSKIAEIEELVVAIGTVVCGEFLVIGAQGITHLMEQAAYRVGADADAEIAQRQGYLGGSSA